MNIHIEDYSPKDNNSKLITVETIVDGEPKDFTFARDEFEEWIGENGCLEVWDDTGFVEEKELSEYWSDSGWQALHENFKKFIEMKYSENVFSKIKNSIDKITRK